jgi:hypothetical protein
MKMIRTLIMLSIGVVMSCSAKAVSLAATPIPTIPPQAPRIEVDAATAAAIEAFVADYLHAKSKVLVETGGNFDQFTHSPEMQQYLDSPLDIPKVGSVFSYGYTIIKNDLTFTLIRKLRPYQDPATGLIRNFVVVLGTAPMVSVYMDGKVAKTNKVPAEFHIALVKTDDGYRVHSDGDLVPSKILHNQTIFEADAGPIVEKMGK